MSQQSTLHAPDGFDIGLVPSGEKSENVTHNEVRKYSGSGTYEDPYVVDWDVGDVENPYNWPKSRKWAITFQVNTTLYLAISQELIIRFSWL